MNKKYFLLLVPVCLVICLSLITCEEEEEVLTGNIWVLLRNTTWTKEVLDYTIGFYGPMNGPYRNLAGDSPYIVIRTDLPPLPGDTSQWETKGAYNFCLLQTMQIDRTGKKISIGDRHFYINFEGLERLTIYDARGALISPGAFSKISSDPNYNWDFNGGGGTPTKPDFDEKLFGIYNVTYLNSSSKMITEIIQINETNFKIEDNDPTGRASLYFEISDWKSDVTPSTYSSDYPNAFKITGRITGANPQQGGDKPSLYGNKTAPGFTAADINSTDCWMYLYFDNDGEELIRTAFSKTGNLNENVYTESNNMARIYRRFD
jgi:hypothetical protein